MLGLDFENLSTTSMHDEVLAAGASEDFTFAQPREAFQFPLPQEGIDELFFSGSYESPSSPVSVGPQQQLVVASSSIPVQSQVTWEAPKAASAKRVHVPVERETKVKKRKQQHQQKDKERRHRINEGLKQLGNLVQSATTSFARLDQPTIVSSSISLIKSLQSEVAALRAQLSGGAVKESVKEEKHALVSADQHSHEGACPVFSSVAGAGVALIMIRADDLSIVEANSVLANILGYSDSKFFVGTAVWDRPLHSRLYQLDRHGRVVNDNSNPFAMGQTKVKLEDGSEESRDDSHIDCLWTARTANGNTLSARVTLSVLKGDDAKPTHFLLCSLPSQRSVAPTPASAQSVQSQEEVECAC